MFRTFSIDPKRIRLAISYLVNRLESRGVRIPNETSTSSWDAESSYECIYASLTILMTDFVGKLFGGNFPGISVSQRIFAQAHPYFAFVLQEKIGQEDFLTTYHFVRATWDFDYDEP